MSKSSTGKEPEDTITEETPLGNNEGEDQGLGFIGHLIELRDRLLRSVVVIILIFLCAFPFANEIYHILALPLVSNLPEGGSMIATGVISPFLTPIKLAFIMSIFAAFPYLIFQAWAFIAPGLYRHEKKLAIPLIVSTGTLPRHPDAVVRSPGRSAPRRVTRFPHRCRLWPQSQVRTSAAARICNPSARG